MRVYDFGDVQIEVCIPFFSSVDLRLHMFGVVAPRLDGFQTIPVRYRNAKTLRIAGAVKAQAARLLRRQFDHAIGGLGVTFWIVRGALIGENHGIGRAFGLGVIGHLSDPLMSGYAIIKGATSALYLQSEIKA